MLSPKEFITNIFYSLFHLNTSMQSTGSGSAGFTGGQYSEPGTSADNKMALADFGSFRSVVKVE